MAPLIPVAVSLIAELVPELISIFGNKKQAEVAGKVMDIAKQVTGAESPDYAARAIAADPSLALKFKEAVLSQQTEIERIGFEREKLYVADTQDARKYRDDKVFKLGLVILASFVAVMSVTLMGLYLMVTGKVTIDQAIFAGVIGLVGAIVGYFASNAQQVVSYFFGSSAGSKANAAALRDSIQGLNK